jgi:ribose transport system permease protein
MRRLLGVTVMVVALYAVLMTSFKFAQSLDNHETLARRLGFYGVLTLGVGVLIVSGGIDLSIGSLVGLGAVCFGYLMDNPVPLLTNDWVPGFLRVSPTYRAPAAVSALAVVLASSVVGLCHGLLITKIRLQPFLVTLCGLFMYRGLARWVSKTSVGLPDRPEVDALRRLIVSGTFLGVANLLWLLLILAALLAVFLHGSVYGRYLYAIGYNEQAARYAGIATDRHKILAYVLCSTLAGLGGVLFLLEYRNATPSSAGSLLELYAITGAVLGGCSLRGGEGTIPGMLLGAAVLPLLQQICTFSPYIGSDLEYTVIGAALLLGTVANEVLKGGSRSKAG